MLSKKLIWLMVSLLGIGPICALQITATEQFQALLSADLNKVSCLYFWATWAEPCKQMTQVVTELAKKYQEVLFLDVRRIFLHAIFTCEKHTCIG